MTDKDKPTDASKVELEDEDLDKVQGGAGYMKIGDLKGETIGTTTSSISPNFSKTDAGYKMQKPLGQGRNLKDKTIKW